MALSKVERRLRIRRRIRKRVSGTAQKPRLSVFRSNANIYAQIIDDVNGVTLASASSVDMKLENGTNIAAATAVGKAVGEAAIAKNIKKVVFDRGGYVYHGRVKALAEAAREAGLEFQKEVNMEQRKPRNNGPRNNGPRRGQRNNGPRREEKEFEERVVTINRVTKVVKGGRRMRFAALVVIGDRKGRVGFGTGKANEVPDAIRKACENAKRNVIKVPSVHGTIPHEVNGVYGSGNVFIKPASQGTGIIAGGPVRAVVELAGYRDILSKCIGSRTPINMVRATMQGLASLKTVNEVAELREKTVDEIFGQEANKMAKVSITLKKSPIGCLPNQRKTLKALGLTKINKTVELENNPTTQGMIRVVGHLVTVEEK